MLRLLSLVSLALALVGCATRATPPATVSNTPPPVAPAPVRRELLPLNSSGEMLKQVPIDGGVVAVGLVDHEPTIKVVRVVGRLQSDLFVPPLQISGVPSHLRFDYQIDPAPSSDDAKSSEFRLVASAGDKSQFTYHVTWVFTWNAGRGTFDIAPPTVERQDRSICLPCFG